MATRSVVAVAPADVGVEIGTFFVRSWGYDQTNIDFYKVVGLTPKGVRLQHWSSRLVDENRNITHVVPGDRPAQVKVWTTDQDVLRGCGECVAFTESQYGRGHTVYSSPHCTWHRPRDVDAPIETKRLQSYRGADLDTQNRYRAYVSVGQYGDGAYLWDGKPEYETASGYGH